MVPSTGRPAKTAGSISTIYTAGNTRKCQSFTRRAMSSSTNTGMMNTACSLKAKEAAIAAMPSTGRPSMAQYTASSPSAT